MYKTIRWIAIILIAGALYGAIDYWQDLKDNRRIVEEINEEKVMGEWEEEGLPEKQPMIDSYKQSLVKNRQSQWIEKNDDYVGWLSIAGTAINEPVVKASDNEYYLSRDFYEEDNVAGSLFMDYRNLGNDFDKHLVIYGHNMKDGSKFHNLRFYRDPEFLMSHETILFEGLYRDVSFRIFSVYAVSADDEPLRVNIDQDELPGYVRDLMSKSLIPVEIDPAEIQQIITLATCTYDIEDGRLIVHGYRE